MYVTKIIVQPQADNLFADKEDTTLSGNGLLMCIREIRVYRPRLLLVFNTQTQLNFLTKNNLKVEYFLK